MSIKSANLVVDGAALYSWVAHQNRGASRRNRARVNYKELMDRISEVIPLADTMIAVTRDKTSQRQEIFVESLRAVGYNVMQVPFDSRPNTSAPLSVTVARYLGIKHNEGAVIVTNDVYLWPAVLAHADETPEDEVSVIAFPRSGMGSVWNGKLFPTNDQPVEQSEQPKSPLLTSVVSEKIKFLDLEHWAKPIFNLDQQQ